MKPIEAYYAIREAILLRPELRYTAWPHHEVKDDILKDNPYCGFCHIATEVFCHLIPEATPWKIGHKYHSYAKIEDKIWDLTADQFNHILDYSTGRRSPKKPLSHRAQSLLKTTKFHVPPTI